MGKTRGNPDRPPVAAKKSPPPKGSIAKKIPSQSIQLVSKETKGRNKRDSEPATQTESSTKRNSRRSLKPRTMSTPSLYKILPISPVKTRSRGSSRAGMEPGTSDVAQPAAKPSRAGRTRSAVKTDTRETNNTPVTVSATANKRKSEPFKAIKLVQTPIIVKKRPARAKSEASAVKVTNNSPTNDEVTSEDIDLESTFTLEAETPAQRAVQKSNTNESLKPASTRKSTARPQKSKPKLKKRRVTRRGGSISKEEVAGEPVLLASPAVKPALNRRGRKSAAKKESFEPEIAIEQPEEVTVTKTVRRASLSPNRAKETVTKRPVRVASPSQTKEASSKKSESAGRYKVMTGQTVPDPSITFRQSNKRRITLPIVQDQKRKRNEKTVAIKASPVLLQTQSLASDKCFQFPEVPPVVEALKVAPKMVDQSTQVGIPFNIPLFVRMDPDGDYVVAVPVLDSEEIIIPAPVVGPKPDTVADPVQEAVPRRPKKVFVKSRGIIEKGNKEAYGLPDPTEEEIRAAANVKEMLIPLQPIIRRNGAPKLSFDEELDEPIEPIEVLATAPATRAAPSSPLFDFDDTSLSGEMELMNEESVPVQTVRSSTPKTTPTGIVKTEIIVSRNSPPRRTQPEQKEKSCVRNLSFGDTSSPGSCSVNKCSSSSASRSETSANSAAKFASNSISPNSYASISSSSNTFASVSSSMYASSSTFSAAPSSIYGAASSSMYVARSSSTHASNSNSGSSFASSASSAASSSTVFSTPEKKISSRNSGIKYSSSSSPANKSASSSSPANKSASSSSPANKSASSSSAANKAASSSSSVNKHPTSSSSTEKTSSGSPRKEKLFPIKSAPSTSAGPSSSSSSTPEKSGSRKEPKPYTPPPPLVSELVTNLLKAKHPTSSPSSLDPRKKESDSSEEEELLDLDDSPSYFTNHPLPSSPPKPKPKPPVSSSNDFVVYNASVVTSKKVSFPANLKGLGIMDESDEEDEDLLDLDFDDNFKPCKPLPRNSPTPNGNHEKISSCRSRIQKVRDRMKQKSLDKQMEIDSKTPPVFRHEIYPLKKPPSVKDLFEWQKRPYTMEQELEDSKRIPILRYFLNKSDPVKYPLQPGDDPRKQVMQEMLASVARIKRMMAIVESKNGTEEGEEEFSTIPSPLTPSNQNDSKPRRRSIRWKSPMVACKSIPDNFAVRLDTSRNGEEYRDYVPIHGVDELDENAKSLPGISSIAFISPDDVQQIRIEADAQDSTVAALQSQSESPSDEDSTIKLKCYLTATGELKYEPASENGDLHTNLDAGVRATQSDADPQNNNLNVSHNLDVQNGSNQTSTEIIHLVTNLDEDLNLDDTTMSSNREVSDPNADNRG